MSRARFYAADLAFVHDRGFGDLAAGAARELVLRMRRAGLRGGPVVDLGCGSGILAARLGHRVRLFHAAELADDLRRAGFAVRRLRGYGRRRFDRDQAGFVARRR